MVIKGRATGYVITFDDSRGYFGDTPIFSDIFVWNVQT